MILPSPTQRVIDSSRAARLRLRSAVIGAAAAAVLAAPAGRADPPRPNTSAWTCKLCVFYTGTKVKVKAGVIDADGANFASGRYSGIDHSGAYADAGASGRWRTRGGDYGSFDADHLGLPSRHIGVTLGAQRRYEVHLTYQGQPYRQYDDAKSPYRTGTNGEQVLPGDWVAANTTTGMTALAASLESVPIESERRTVTLSGRYFTSSVWTLFGKLSHTQRTGTTITGASFLTEAVQLPEPIDYVTDNVHVGVLWSNAGASARIAYEGSWFDDEQQALLFQNPFQPLLPGSTAGLLSLDPNNDLQQASLSGEETLPFWSGVLSYLASVGRLAEDGSFVPGSTLSAVSQLSGSLPGDIDLTHYALALALRPLDRLTLRGRAVYDGHDDHTAVLAIPQIVTDTFPGGIAVTPRYTEDRVRLTGSAQYRLFSWARISVGGHYDHTHFGPLQVLSSLGDLKAWGEATLSPTPALSLTVKGGSSRRNASALNAVAVPAGEDPQLLAFDYAPRDRQFLTLRATWAINTHLAFSLEGSAATNAYRVSQLGLSDTRERDLSGTLEWSPAVPWSLYLDSSYQHLESGQYGQQLPAGIAWQAREGEYFWTAGTGGSWIVSTRWHVRVDYVYATSRANTTVASVDGFGGFPQNDTSLDTVKVLASYVWSAALSLHLRYERANFGSNDWALQSVYPDTVPQLLALGVQPYRYGVNLFAVSFLYRLGQ